VFTQWKCDDFRIPGLFIPWKCDDFRLPGVFT
jgi:hypothetical protein